MADSSSSLDDGSGFACSLDEATISCECRDPSGLTGVCTLESSPSLWSLTFSFTPFIGGLCITSRIPDCRTETRNQLRMNQSEIAGQVQFTQGACDISLSQKMLLIVLPVRHHVRKENAIPMLGQPHRTRMTSFTPFDLSKNKLTRF